MSVVTVKTPPTKAGLVRDAFDDGNLHIDSTLAGDENVAKIISYAKRIMETKQGEIYDVSTESVVSSPTDEQIDTQNTRLLQAYKSRADARGVFDPNVFQEGYKKGSTIDDMRALCKIWYEESTSSSRVARAYDSSVPGAVCHVTSSDGVETFRDYTFALAPWQVVGARHIASFCRMQERFGAVFLNHGTGTGKSTTFGMAAIQLMAPNTMAQVSPRDQFSVFFIVPDKKGGPVAAAKEASIEPIFADILKASGQAMTGAVTGNFSNFFSRKTVCTNDPTVISFGVSGSKRPNPTAGGSNAKVPKQPRAVQRFRLNNIYMYKENYMDLSEENQIIEDAVFNKFLEDGLEDTLKADKKPTSFLFVIDESHTFFKSAKRMTQLEALLRKVHESAMNRALFVFASATPFEESVESKERFEQFLAIGKGNSLPSVACTMTRMEEIPISARAARCNKAFKDGTYGDLDYFMGVKISKGANGFIFPGDIKKCVPQRLIDVLLHFYGECTNKDGPPYPKCAILVPTAWLHIDEGGTVVRVSTSKPVTGDSLYFYDVLQCLLQTRGADVMPIVDNASGNAVYFLEKNANVDVVPQNHLSGHVSTHPNIHKAVFAKETYTKTQSGANAVSGADAFSTSLFIEKHLPIHDDRLRELGLKKNHPPACDIIFVDRTSTGIDLQGVTLEYVLHKPETYTEFVQLTGRGIRICSLAGFPDKAFKTTVHNVGFDHRTLKEETDGYFDAMVVDTDLYKNKVVEDECNLKSASTDRKFARHNLVPSDLEKRSDSFVQGKPPRYAVGVYDAESAGDIFEYLRYRDPSTSEYRALLHVLHDIHKEYNNQRTFWSRPKSTLQDFISGHERFDEFVETLLKSVSGRTHDMQALAAKMGVGASAATEFAANKEYLAELTKRFNQEVWVSKLHPDAAPPVNFLFPETSYSFQWFVDGKPDLTTDPNKRNWYAVPVNEETEDWWPPKKYPKGTSEHDFTIVAEDDDIKASLAKIHCAKDGCEVRAIDPANTPGLGPQAKRVVVQARDFQHQILPLISEVYKFFQNKALEPQKLLKHIIEITGAIAKGASAVETALNAMNINGPLVKDVAKSLLVSPTANIELNLIWNTHVWPTRTTVGDFAEINDARELDQKNFKFRYFDVLPTSSTPGVIIVPTFSLEMPTGNDESENRRATFPVVISEYKGLQDCLDLHQSADLQKILDTTNNETKILNTINDEFLRRMVSVALHMNKARIYSRRVVIPAA